MLLSMSGPAGGIEMAELAAGNKVQANELRPGIPHGYNAVVMRRIRNVIFETASEGETYAGH